jgi:uncharacterized Zn-finger protein
MPIFKCELCNITCTRSHDYKRHIESNKHKNNIVVEVEEDNNIQCDNCLKHFSCMPNLYKHIRNEVCKEKEVCKGKGNITKKDLEILELKLQLQMKDLELKYQSKMKDLLFESNYKTKFNTKENYSLFD